MNSDPSERTKLLVRYRSQLFDLTAFASKHPGGRNTLTAALQTDIDYKFDEAVPHSDAAKYLINEYRAQGSPEANNNDQTAGTEYEKAVANNKSADGVAADANGPHILELDESMEVMGRPMGPIGSCLFTLAVHCLKLRRIFASEECC